MADVSQRFRDRNLLFAVGVLPPALFLFDAPVALGLLLTTCVVAGRCSLRRHHSHEEFAVATSAKYRDFGP